MKQFALFAAWKENDGSVTNKLFPDGTLDLLIAGIKGLNDQDTAGKIELIQLQVRIKKEAAPVVKQALAKPGKK